MNVTLNTVNFNNYKNTQKANPSFEGSVPPQSAFLNPFKRGYLKMLKGIGKHYTAPLYQSKLAQYLVKHADKLEGPAGHMQTVGSFIVTGMYMEQTMTNKRLDKDKKKTLAVNQFLTLFASTLGAYLVDGKLNNIWENLTRKYMAKNLGKDVKTLNKEIDEWNIGEKKKFDYKVEIGDIAKDAVFKPGKVEDYIDKTMKNSELTKYVKGMGILKKMLIFGTIYRFISPVAVTPIANWIGNKLFYNEHKHPEQKQETKVQTAEQKQAPKSQTMTAQPKDETPQQNTYATNLPNFKNFLKTA